jgi:hypothetical protein
MQVKARAATAVSSAARISWRRRTIKGGEIREPGRGGETLGIDYSIAKIKDGAPSSAIDMGTPSLHRHFGRMKVL